MNKGRGYCIQHYPPLVGVLRVTLALVLAKHDAAVAAEEVATVPNAGALLVMVVVVGHDLYIYMFYEYRLSK